jgi:hypothetical protein
VLLNEARNHFHISIQSPDGSFLILADESAIPLHVGTQDGCKFAFEFFCWRGVISLKVYNGKEGDKGILALGWFKIPVTIRKSAETFLLLATSGDPFS